MVESSLDSRALLLADSVSFDKIRGELYFVVSRALENKSIGMKASLRML